MKKSDVGNTKSLEKIDTTLDGENINIEVYKDGDDYRVNISSENTSGADYPIESVEDISKALTYYIETYVL